MSDESPNNRDPRVAPGETVVPTGTDVVETVSTSTVESRTEGDRLIEEAEQLLRRSSRRQGRVIVVGGGPGGLAAARRAARLGARTTLVEQGELGGAHLNWGGVAVRALLDHTGTPAPPRESATPWKHAREVSTRLAERERQVLEEHGIEVVQGRAMFAGDGLSIDGGLTTWGRGEGALVLATGATPVTPPWASADDDRVMTPSQLLASGVTPTRLTVIGGGAVGTEVASVYALLGSDVTLLEARSRLVPALDGEIGAELTELLRARGLEVLTSQWATEVASGAEGLTVLCESGHEVAPAEVVVLAVGRRPNCSGLDLEAAGISAEGRWVRVDENCRTSREGVYAIGDLVHGSGFATVASLDARLAVDHALGKETTASRHHAPVCVCCSPTLASVGLSEEDARETGREVAVGRARFGDASCASLASSAGGSVKVVAHGQHGRLLGVHLLGPRAEELIGEAVVALSFGATAAELAEVVHPMPGYGEALAAAADAARPSEQGAT